MPDHPNPAEHCKAIGIEVGKDRIQSPSGMVMLVNHIGSNYVQGETPDGRPNTLVYVQDITAWTKVEPPPVVTIFQGESGEGTFVELDNATYFNISAGSQAYHGFGRDRAHELARIGADAIKSAIEADHGKPADAEPVADGPWKVSSDTSPGYPQDFVVSTDDDKFYVTLRCHTSPPAGCKAGVIDEINYRHARQIASELNRLNARQPK